MYTLIQAVHSLLYIVAKCNEAKLKKCEGCTHFCEILHI